MLNDKDLTALNDKLYLPVAVRDIMATAGSLEPDTRYRLHEILSDFQPDSALLCIALTAKEIISVQGYPTASLGVLNARCTRIVKEYAPLWLEHARNKTIDDTLLFETLAQIPDDLSELSMLMDLAGKSISAIDAKAAEILNILKIQAGSHAVIAEEFVDALPEIEETPMPTIAVQIFNDNVIQFPLAVRA